MIIGLTVIKRKKGPYILNKIFLKYIRFLCAFQDITILWSV